MQQHRTSCHRCGNIRRQSRKCTKCVHVYCPSCEQKLKDTDGTDIFDNGCPFCKELCCCTNKTADCQRTLHCYRKCPAVQRSSPLTVDQAFAGGRRISKRAQGRKIASFCHSCLSDPIVSSATTDATDASGLMSPVGISSLMAHIPSSSAHRGHCDMFADDAGKHDIRDEELASFFLPSPTDSWCLGMGDLDARLPPHEFNYQPAADADSCVADILQLMNSPSPSLSASNPSSGVPSSDGSMAVIRAVLNEVVPATEPGTFAANFAEERLAVSHHVPHPATTPISLSMKLDAFLGSNILGAAGSDSTGLTPITNPLFLQPSIVGVQDLPNFRELAMASVRASITHPRWAGAPFSSPSSIGSSVQNSSETGVSKGPSSFAELLAGDLLLSSPSLPLPLPLPLPTPRPRSRPSPDPNAATNSTSTSSAPRKQVQTGTAKRKRADSTDDAAAPGTASTDKKKRKRNLKYVGLGDRNHKKPKEGISEKKPRAEKKSAGAGASGMKGASGSGKKCKNVVSSDGAEGLSTAVTVVVPAVRPHTGPSTGIGIDTGAGAGGGHRAALLHLTEEERTERVLPPAAQRRIAQSGTFDEDDVEELLTFLEGEPVAVMRGTSTYTYAPRNVSDTSAAFWLDSPFSPGEGVPDNAQK